MRVSGALARLRSCEVIRLILSLIVEICLGVAIDQRVVALEGVRELCRLSLCGKNGEFGV